VQIQVNLTAGNALDKHALAVPIDSRSSESSNSLSQERSDAN